MRTERTAALSEVSAQRLFRPRVHVRAECARGELGVGMQLHVSVDEKGGGGERKREGVGKGGRQGGVGIVEVDQAT